MTPRIEVRSRIPPPSLGMRPESTEPPIAASPSLVAGENMAERSKFVKRLHSFDTHRRLVFRTPTAQRKVVDDQAGQSCQRLCSPKHFHERSINLQSALLKRTSERSRRCSHDRASSMSWAKGRSMMPVSQRPSCTCACLFSSVSMFIAATQCFEHCAFASQDFCSCSYTIGGVTQTTSRNCPDATRCGCVFRYDDGGNVVGAEAVCLISQSSVVGQGSEP